MNDFHGLENLIHSILNLGQPHVTCANEIRFSYKWIWKLSLAENTEESAHFYPWSYPRIYQVSSHFSLALNWWSLAVLWISSFTLSPTFVFSTYLERKVEKKSTHWSFLVTLLDVKWKSKLVTQPCPTLVMSLTVACPGPWNSPGKNTGVGCHLLFQGILPTRGLNLGLLYCRDSLPTEPLGKPRCKPWCKCRQGWENDMSTGILWGGMKSESKVTQSCPTLCDPMDSSLPGFYIHGVFQARVLEWVASAFSRG